MTLGTSRIVIQGETAYAHEREAIDFVIEALPNSEPYQVWALFELLEPSSGRLYEIDLLVLGYSALYLVEVKSGPGKYQGDTQDWHRTPPGENTPRWMENPYRLTNTKAKVLASRLRAKMKNARDVPWIEPLVFLSASDVQLAFHASGGVGVVTRDTFKRAVQFHEIPGVTAARSRQAINTPLAREVAQALSSLGLRPRAGKAYVGSYELGSLLGDGPGYQDRVATHRDQKAFTRRARTYAVPAQTSVERRQQLRRAADREHHLLWDVREHENILRVTDYVTDAEIGPTVFFEPFDGIPLDAFMRKETLDFFERIEIISQLGHALAWCHRKGVVHGALSPEAVLVRRNTERGKLETRIFNFQLGWSPDVEATTHWSALASEPWAIYQAPELRENPLQRSATSDVFSLGALAFMVLTGRAPGASAVEVDQRLSQQRCLDPRSVDDTLPNGVADLVMNATRLSPVQRWNDAETWVELLLGEVTKPAPPAATVAELNPLDARPGDELGGVLLVDQTPDGRPSLGQGATARVLLVQRYSDQRSYALKVSLSAEHDERLGQEAAVLERLQHPRIVRLVARHNFGGRPALLLSLAGPENLHRHLSREGTVSLDRAAVYGEDLLSALEHLEENQVLHRDIKPANLGVGIVAKGAHHLGLFDFSLAAAPATELQVGTAAYRDPFLRLRGTWDYFAERWSAAFTLHEMLTGTRPSFAGDTAAIDADSKLVVAVERFDPSVRDKLAAFFARAFARDVKDRFSSAGEMRHAWTAAFDAPHTVSPSVPTDGAAGAVEGAHAVATLSEAFLATISPDAPIEALPLAPRARNALDRAGLLIARDLLNLADNRLSAIRGVGQAVADEILNFKTRWAAAQTDTVFESTPFFPGYRGEDIALDGTTLAAQTILALEDAGLPSLAAVASAPARQIQQLARRCRFDDKIIRALLDAENAKANERARPSTIEGWVEALLSKKKKSLRHARELFGLDDPFVGRIDVTVRELAEKADLSTAALYISIGKARDDWAKHTALDELRERAAMIVDHAGGALPFVQAARGLMSRIPFDRNASEALVVAQAAALLRVIVEVDKDDDEGLRLIRLASGSPWLCVSDDHGRVVKALGAVADELAGRSPLAGPGEVARLLLDAAKDGPLATLSAERLADIAALASEKAARSARLEIYPRGLAAERALDLSAAQLRNDLTEAEVSRRVQLRYPEAERLPPRPALDALLRVHGLEFDDAVGRYLRASGAERTTLGTQMQPIERAPTALPTQAMSMEPDAVGARQFDEKLRNALERRAFRVLGVSADRAALAATRVAERAGAQPVALDRLFIEAMRAQMRAGGITREDVVHDADRLGTGKPWENLLRLVERASASVASQLLPAKTPLVLVQPGLIARYRLTSFLEKLMAATTERDCSAIFLVVPGRDTGGIPRINGVLPIPGLLASQVLWVSPDWLENRHNKAA